MPGGIISTGSHPKALWPGVHAFWGQVYNQHETEYTDLYNVQDTGRAFEEDVQITGFGLAKVKEEGGPISMDSEIQGAIQRYIPVAYALGYKVTFEERNDNLYSEISMRRASANAFSIAQTIENLAAAPYNDAFSGNVFTFSTGASLISTSQVNATGGTYANALSPAADLCEASLEDICVQSMGLQTDRGLLISIMPVSLHVPRQEWFNANRVLKAALQPDTASNNPNVLRTTNAFPGGIKMNHYFTSAHAWMVRTNCPNGMTMFWRNRPEFDQDNDWDTKNAKAATYFRCSFGATDPRSILGSNGP